ncbi:hypothetical protein [Frankia sp. R43]|uniref:hypothetical protein n=1 Tax=Frankia sp. R43 TaxID=269536 RepID=UPI00137AF5F4|nr:hypothetical protein [Frankia sp. R43]
MTEGQLNKILDRQFVKFYGLIDRRLHEVRDELHTEIADLKDDVNHVRNVLDSVVGDIQDIKTEVAAIGSQLDRHDQALTQLADHTGIQLQYE